MLSPLSLKLQAFLPLADGSDAAKTRFSVRLGRFSEVSVLFASLSSQIRIRDPNQGGRDVTEEILAGGSGSRNSTPPVGCSSSTPTPPQVRPALSCSNLDTCSPFSGDCSRSLAGFTATMRCVYFSRSSYRIHSLCLSSQSGVHSNVVSYFQVQASTTFFFFFPLWVLLRLM